MSYSTPRTLEQLIAHLDSGDRSIGPTPRQIAIIVVDELVKLRARIEELEKEKP